MSSRDVRRRGRLVVVASVLVAAGALAGGVIAGRMVWMDDAATLDRARAAAPAVRLAEISGMDGKSSRGVFGQLTSTGHFCLSDAPLDAPLMGGGGCNSASDPLGGSAISASLAYDGGPTIESVKDARLIGLASAGTATVRVLMSDRTFRSVELKKAKVGSDEFQAFGYRFKNADLKRRIGPTAIVAYDAGGAEIGRQPTGIG